MKKLFWSILCIASLLASCSEIEIDVNAIEAGEEFTATVAETRAELDGVAVLWNEADELTIFTKTAHNRHYRVKSLSNGNRSATFGYVSYSGNDNTKISNNYAVYPYDADATLSGEVITTKLNAEQVYNAEKVDLANALMVAKSTSTALQFVNATSLMRFDVSNNMPDSYTLSSIKLVSAANKLAGEVTINLSADSKAVVTESGVNEVILSAINCEISAEKQSFYVVLPATTFAAKDLTVTFTYAEGVEKSFQLPAFELELGSIKTIAYTINDGEDFEGSTPDSGEDFEGDTPGAVVKPANNEIWYTTTDGNVIELYEYDYCFGANIVSNTYVDGKGVIKFDSDATQLIEAFENDETLLTVTLPDSVKKLGSFAFSQCPNLTTINFGDGVTSFEDNFIYSCPSLSKFTGSIASKDGYSLIINGVLIYVLSFDESVTTYVIPEGVLSFYITNIVGSSNITEIVIPNSIVNLNGFDAITAKLTNVKLFSGKFASEDGSCLIENSDLRYFAPQALAFLTSYNVPNGVTKISTQFPASSTLTTVTFADGITEVAAGLLNKCPNVQSVAGNIATADGKCIAINNELIDIVDNNLTSYTIPEGITTIGYNAFSNKNIESITVAKSVNTIKNNAFSSQYIKEIYFKSTTPATISGSLFNFWIIDENIKLYVLTSAVDAYKSAWSDYASFIAEYPTTPANNEIWYTNGSTTDATTPNKLNAFGVNITSNTYDVEKECWVITFDGDLTAIGNEAFDGCNSLTSITIPDSVTTIGNNDSPFSWCNNLQKFNGKFASKDGRCIIVDGTLNSFAPAGLTEYTIPNSATTIGTYAFAYCNSLTSVTMPANVTKIQARAFDGCTSLTSIIIPDSVTTIGYAAFYNCDSLKSVTIGDSVTSIGGSAFYWCDSLTSVTIPDSVTTIGDNAFYSCTSLKSVTIGDSVTSIGYAAFYGCDLTSVTIPDSVTEVENESFAYCTSLTSVTIGDSVTTIGNEAFNGCYSLTSVTIPNSVTRIGYAAFSSCRSLTSVTIGNSVTRIENNAFAYCSSLTSVYCKATTPPTAGYYMFNNNASGRKIYVPMESVEVYKNTERWSDYMSDIVGYDF